MCSYHYYAQGFTIYWAEYIAHIWTNFKFVSKKIKIGLEYKVCIVSKV